MEITIKIEFMWSQMENKNIQNIVLPFRSLATLPRNIGKKQKFILKGQQEEKDNDFLLVASS